MRLTVLLMLQSLVTTAGHLPPANMSNMPHEAVVTQHVMRDCDPSTQHEPSSSMTGVKCLAAAVMTILPTVPLPVYMIKSYCIRRHTAYKRACRDTKQDDKGSRKSFSTFCFRSSVVSGTPPSTHAKHAGSRYCVHRRRIAAEQCEETCPQCRTRHGHDHASLSQVNCGDHHKAPCDSRDHIEQQWNMTQSVLEFATLPQKASE